MNKKNNLYYAIDFDGTCTTHDYPDIGKDIGAARVLKRMAERGDKLILYTMRSGKQLHEAAKWFHDNNIPLFGAQLNPTQSTWTQSTKCYAHVYIDDAALGAPLKYDLSIHPRPFIDWDKVEQMLFPNEKEKQTTDTTSDTTNQGN